MRYMRYRMACLLAVAAMLLTVVSSCTLETSDNGDLDGFWHLTRVDTLATGGSCDMSERLVFWSVQMDLVNVTDRGDGGGDYFMRFDKSGMTLRLYEPYRNDRMQGDGKIDDALLLAPLGINSLDETFRIERLSGSRMTLRGGKLLLYFSKM